MAEGPSYQQQQQQQQHHLPLLHNQLPPPPSQRYRGGLRSTPGEIVEVQGGHIVRSTGRKDRHSKVCTAKGPRDRRVRLSAYTAVQFYDVQDRLGYDRPSKAVDWLIKNAKAAIDELAELPAWHPTTSVNPPAPPPPSSNNLDFQDASHGVEAIDKQMHVEFGGDGGGGGGCSSSLLPPSLDSDAIADTIKSFFPMAAAAAAGSNSSLSAAAPPSSSSPAVFQNYLPDLLSRTSSQNQDLRLSLHSFQDPIFHRPNAAAAQHQQHYHHQHHAANAAGHHGLFSGIDSSAMVPWNVQESSGGGGGSGNGSGANVGGVGGYVFNVPLQLQHQQTVAMHPGLGHGQSQFFTQRGPLQSSNPPFVRAWADPMAAVADHHSMHSVIHPSISFTSDSSYSGFRIPARIQGEEEQHDGISDKPSSASSGSHH